MCQMVPATPLRDIRTSSLFELRYFVTSLNVGSPHISYFGSSVRNFEYTKVGSDLTPNLRRALRVIASGSDQGLEDGVSEGGAKAVTQICPGGMGLASESRLAGWD